MQQKFITATVNMSFKTCKPSRVYNLTILFEETQETNKTSTQSQIPSSRSIQTLANKQVLESKTPW